MTKHTEYPGKYLSRQSINDRFDRPDRYDDRDQLDSEPIIKSVVSFESDYGPAPDPDASSQIEARIRHELLEAEKACGGPL